MKNFYFTLPDILEYSAQRIPNKTAIIDGAKKITYEELHLQSNAFARFLINKGLTKGDRVGIYLDSSIKAIIAIWGITKAGGIFVNINSRLIPSQVYHHIDNCQMKFLITSDIKKRTLAEHLHSMIIETNLFPAILQDFSDGSPFVPLLIETDIAAIIYTSGSTGLAKGVVLNHRNLILSAEMTITFLESTEKDIIIGLVPFNFDNGINQLFISAIVGATFVLQKFLLPNDICKTLLERKITGLSGVPTLWIQLLEDKKSTLFCKSEFPDLRYATVSGGKLHETYLRKLQGILKHTKIFLTYGLTEAFRSTYLEPEQISQRPNSIGKAIPNVEVILLNKEGNRCQIGEPGELVHRGGVIFQGYWNDPETTNKIRKPLPPGFVSDSVCSKEMAIWSNDNVVQDEDGYFFFINRTDDMIKSSGYRISPQEIEDILYNLGEIKETMVFGTKDDILGAKIKAVVSLKTDSQLSEKEIISYCKSHLPSYMIPHHVVIIDNLPRTANQKLDRVKIKQEYSEN